MNKVDSTTLTKANDLRQLKKRVIWASLSTIASLVLIVGSLSYFFKTEIHLVSQWVLDHLGFKFLAALVFVSDTLVSPVPPDAILFVIATSRLAEDSFFYVGIISLCSLAGGYVAWFSGYLLSKRNWVPEFAKTLADENKDLIKKYGAFAVMLGALTPLPFSITCWSAGFLHLDFKTFSLGAITRVPRIFIYYWIIKASEVTMAMNY